MTAFLADGNLLVALVVSDHVHHGTAVEWFERTEPSLATCPITEGTLIRFLARRCVAQQQVGPAAGVVTGAATSLVGAQHAPPSPSVSTASDMASAGSPRR
ncbi:MAG: hypothetical protein ACKO5A_09745 [Actinomycetota bacterium]